MPSLLIAVHGMGDFKPGWSADIQKKLEDSAALYPGFAGQQLFGSGTDFVEVTYDQITQQIVSSWNGSRTEFQKFADAQSNNGANWNPSPLYSFLDDTTLPADTTGFFWTAAIDPVLYRGCALVRDPVRTTATKAIFDAITTASAKAGGAAVDVSILAHSMGTIVTHDILQQVATGAVGGNASYSPSKFVFKNLFMVADVSRLGPPDLIDLRVDKAGYCVRPLDPRPGKTPKGTYYTENFFSFRHELDPFVRWAPLDPSSWGGDWGARFHDVKVNHLHQANVHGFTHYLDHPNVHIPILNGIAGFSAVSKAEQDAAAAKYPQYVSPECQAAIDTFKQLVQSFPQTLDKPSDFSSIGVYGATYYAAAKKLADTCKNLSSGL